MKQFLTPYIFITFFCCCISGLSAQNLTLKIATKDSTNYAILENLKFKENHTTEKSISSELDSVSLLFENMGYFNNRLDSLTKMETDYTAYFTLGKSHKTIQVFYDNSQIEKELLRKVSKKVTDTYFEVPIDLLQQGLNAVLADIVEKGNTFATLKLADIALRDTIITATLNITSSTTRTIDKIVIRGIENFPKAYITTYLGIRRNTIFSQDNLAKISEQVNALPFASELKPPEVLFTKDSTYLYIYLKKKKSNKFDGLVGFFSNEENKGLKFNGYLDVALNNVFNGGESILVNWRNNGNDRQLFDFSIETPYVFNSSFSPKANLNIYKQDSSFINTTSNIALQYAINYKNKIGLSFINESSTNLRENAPLDLNSYTTNLYGVTYAYRTFNTIFLYPIKFNISIDAHTGNRKIKGSETTQTKLNLDTSYLWNLNAKNHLYVRSYNGIFFSDTYFTNELYRIGGANTIRGFNEESIVASLFNIFNIEYRYAANSSSYLYTITDFAYTMNGLDDQNQKLYGLGLGYAFSTKVGLLNLSYAIGKTDEQPFNFSNSRFHLKILSFF